MFFSWVKRYKATLHLLKRHRVVVTGAHVAHIPNVSWHKFSSGAACEHEAVIVQNVAVEKGSRARVKCDRMSVIKCEREAAREGSLLS
jgi:hypothetical protein